ncbi:MAG: tetratricopeptide repeat protein [Pirellulales bacterium]
MGARMIWSATAGLCVLAVWAAAAPVVAATAGELLQKAIYTEETVGNLDEAMKLYEQVIAEGKSAQEAAAQAQFRLALCLQKKGRDAEAKKAFEAVVNNFPNQKDLVAQARLHLSSELKLLPAPWTPGERQQLNMTLPSGLPIGTMIYMVDDAERDGKKVTRCSTRGVVTVNGASSLSEVYCQTESFAPIESLWKHTLLGEARAKYGEDSVDVTMIGKDKTFTLNFTPPAFDNEQCVELFRRLPLAEGYKTTITVVTSLGGNQLSLVITVSGKETITVPAGTYECYKLDLSVGQTFWVSTDEHRYVVRFAAGGVTADLAKVWQAEPGKGETVAGDGFSLTLPEGWLSYNTSNPNSSGETELQLLDPRANVNAEVAVRPKSKLKGDQASSTKAWTESFIDDIKKVYGDFAVDEAGLVETKVDGHGATQIVAEFTEGAKKMRVLGVAVIGDHSAATLRFTTEAAKFDGERGAFDKIIEGFKVD